MHLINLCQHTPVSNSQSRSTRSIPHTDRLRPLTTLMTHSSTFVYYRNQSEQEWRGAHVAAGDLQARWLMMVHTVVADSSCCSEDRSQPETSRYRQHAATWPSAVGPGFRISVAPGTSCSAAAATAPETSRSSTALLDLSRNRRYCWELLAATIMSAEATLERFHFETHAVSCITCTVCAHTCTLAPASQLFAPSTAARAGSTVAVAQGLQTLLEGARTAHLNIGIATKHRACMHSLTAVSYTHLTLPTILLV